jgi:hypothetical protein
MTNGSEVTTGKSYATICYGGGDGLGPADAATFTIDLETAEFIVRMAEIVKKEGLDSLSRFDYLQWWEDLDIDDADDGRLNPDTLDLEDGQEMRSECDKLHVGETDFWFSCYRKHCDDLIETPMLPIKELAEHFGIPFRR